MKISARQRFQNRSTQQDMSRTRVLSNAPTAATQLLHSSPRLLAQRQTLMAAVGSVAQLCQDGSTPREQRHGDRGAVSVKAQRDNGLGNVPVQRYRTDAPTASSFTQGNEEKKPEFQVRMAKEMAALREEMARKDALPVDDRDERDVYEHVAPNSGLPKELPSNRPIPEKGVFDAKKRESIDSKMRNRLSPTPKVGISNRAARGFINDSGVFKSAQPGFEGKSLPPGFEPLGWNDEKSKMDKQAKEIREKRSEKQASSHLDDVSGLFIPGGQDREKPGSEEQLSRENYEQALIRGARNRGLPTLAVCGGSRCLARGFGAVEAPLDKKAIETHKQKGQTTMGHGITLRNPSLPVPDDQKNPMRGDAHTLLRGASWVKGKGATNEISSVNSTHEKSVAHKNGAIEPVNKLPSTGESELMTSAWAPEMFPEGFETRYGAPMLGVTSHPEAMHTDPDTILNTLEDAKTWSGNIFKGFAQSMKAYSGKQAVNEQIRTKKARERAPQVYAKWKGKRNWQKLLQLGMITTSEAEHIRAEVRNSRAAKFANMGKRGDTL